jgi:hypothetical protein
MMIFHGNVSLGQRYFLIRRLRQKWIDFLENGGLSNSLTIMTLSLIIGLKKKIEFHLARKDVVLWNDFKPLESGTCWGVKMLGVELGDWLGEIRFNRNGRGVWNVSLYPFRPQENIPVEVLVADQ